MLDIVSNVLLYTEPQKKVLDPLYLLTKFSTFINPSWCFLFRSQEVSELEQRMGFYFQLSTAEDLKGTILNVQNNVR